MKAWGSGDEKVVAKNLELLLNVGRSEDQARDCEILRRWQSKSSLGSGIGGALFKEFQSTLSKRVPQVGDFLAVTPSSVVVASLQSGAQFPHTDVPTQPEVLSSDSRSISGCHLSSFLCFYRELRRGSAGGDGPGGGREGGLGHLSA